MKTIIAFLSIALLLLYSCGGPENLNQVDMGDIPDWYMELPEDENYIYSAKTGTSRDMQLALDKASTAARAEIAQKVEVKVQQLEKRFVEEIGSGEMPTLAQQFSTATKSVVNVTLSDTEVVDKQMDDDGDFWRVYVLMRYPIGEAQTKFLEKIKVFDEFETKIAATNAYKDLEAAVQSYDSK